MISPQFVVPDMKAAAEYYRDVLRFEILGYFCEPPVNAIVQRDDVEIHFGKVDEGHGVAPNIGRRTGSMDAYIWVTDVQCIHIEDQFGFRLTLGMDISGKT